MHTPVQLISGGVCQCPGACGDETAPTLFPWGSERGLRSLLPDEGLAELTVTPRTFYAPHCSPERFWDFLTETNGFIQACLDRTDPATRDEIHREVMTLLKELNNADDDTVVLAQDYRGRRGQGLRRGAGAATWDDGGLRHVPPDRAAEVTSTLAELFAQTRG